METPAAAQPVQETAAPVETDSAPVQATEDVAKPVTETPKDSEPEWFTKRFGEITAKFRGEERARLAAEQKAMELEQRLAQSQPKPEEKVKTLADFDYDEAKFQGYVVEQAKKAAREAASEADRERQEQISAERRARKFKEREVAFEKEAKDYREVAHYAPISDDLAQVIQDLDSGPELAYFLGKNRDIALTLNDLPVHLAAVELGRIDAKITAEKAAKAAALEAARKAKAVTQAPEPATTIEGAGEPGNVKPDEPSSDALSDAEWTRRRNKQLARRK